MTTLKWLKYSFCTCQSTQACCANQTMNQTNLVFLSGRFSSSHELHAQIPSFRNILITMTKTASTSILPQICSAVPIIVKKMTKEEGGAWVCVQETIKKHQLNFTQQAEQRKQWVEKKFGKTKSIYKIF